MYKNEKMSRYILNEVETSHHLILILLYFILTILITEDDHVKQTVENRRPSKMGDVATLLFVHFNLIIQLRNMFLLLKSIHIPY